MALLEAESGLLRLLKSMRTYAGESCWVLRKTTHPIQVHLVGHHSYPGVAGTEQWGLVADWVETAVVVVRQDTRFASDTNILVGSTGTWRRVDTKSSGW